MNPPETKVHYRSPPEAKIALFRSLFRGREDVYPRRFESRTTAKSGYSPACGNEWVRGICEKPRVKCATCQHRQFLPVTDDVIRWHLSGVDAGGADFTAGVYPMLLDETCYFLAMDFDKTHWQQDTSAVLETCRRLNVPAALERSRSGNGGHVWIFFDKAIPATIARRLGSHILTETMECRPDIGLDSYDRFFPNQDTLPRGGFGNLIALPLQKQPRAHGNSEFLDEHGTPYPDQWSYLSSIRRMSRSAVDEIVQAAGRRGRIVNVRIAMPDDDEEVPWLATPSRRPREPAIRGTLPRILTLTLGDQIYIEKTLLPPELRNRLVARRAKAKFVTGLSATVTRKDGHHPIIFMQCGPVRHTVDAKSEAVARPFRHSVVVRPTSFRPITEADADMRLQFQGLYRELSADDERNHIICNDVLQCVKNGRSPLVLTERKEHLHVLEALLKPHIAQIVVLHGGTTVKENRATQEQLVAIPGSEPRVLLATGRYIGEGFDDSRLDTLFLTLPVSWRGTIAQYVGRLHRLHDGKTEVQVYDYADLNVPMLSRMFDRRCQGYEAVGYTVLLPGSAVPGWPAEVPLPVDPQWKNDYAASIRRLVRDGVDEPLAKLFVHAARKIEPAAEGVQRARSASEAFLFRRLETLAETVGRFRMNAELPIAFDGWGKMEVDFLDEENRLVIELDGGQHFGNEDAYRRDRRKDALLQEHGYFVLRFLVQDIGVKLDHVLDTIIRALTHLQKHNGRP